MKTSLHLFFFCLTAVFQLSAQSSLLWESRFNGPIANDQGNVITLDAAGNIYLAGSMDTPAGTSDYLVIKYKPNGDTAWVRTYNGTANGQDEALAIKVDAGGNVYVTGKSQGTGTGVNAVTIKYNATGVLQWAAVYSNYNNSINIGYNLEVDVFGNVYVAAGSIPDGYAIKYSPAGQQLWTTRLFEGDYRIPYLITLNPNDGHVIIATGESTQSRYYLFSLSPVTGSIVKTFNNVLFYDITGIPNTLKLDGQGNIYITSTRGTQLSSTPIAVTTAKFTYAGGAVYNWYYTSSTSSGTMNGVDMQLDKDLNIYVLVNWYAGNKFQPHYKKLDANGQFVWGFPENTSKGIEMTPIALNLINTSNPPELIISGNTALGDIKLMKLNASGDTLWTRTYDCGNRGTDLAAAMVLDQCDNIYITGSSNCNGTSKDVKTIKFASAAAPSVAASGPLSFCPGGSVTLTSSPSNAYAWSNGANTRSITVSASGNYQVTVTDLSGCQAVSQSLQVTVFSSPTATITPSGAPAICQGGSLTLTANEASAYSWSNGATTRSITVSNAGTYRVTITNANGCSGVSAPVMVTVNPAPTATVAPNGPVTFCDGGSVILTSGLASVYQWSNGATIQNVAVSTSGTYRVTITDAAGCTAVSQQITVTVHPLPNAQITANGPTTLCQGSSVVLSASAGQTYAWSNGASSRQITVTASGDFTVTVTNMEGCSAQAQAVKVTVNPAPSAAISASGPTTFCEGGSVFLTASQANSYRWSHGPTSQNVLVSATGNYTVTVTNEMGCSASTQVQVTATPVAKVELVPMHTNCDKTDGFIIANLSGGSPISGFSWSNGAATQNIANLTGGVYTLTATDVNGCKVNAQTTVIGRKSPVVKLGRDTAIQQGQQLILKAGEGPGLTYSWSTGSNTATITVTQPGVYSVTVANSDGCTASASITVSIVTSNFDLNRSVTIRVFPNPAGELLNVQCEGQATTQVRIIDNLGRTHLTDNARLPAGATRTLHLGELPPGIYFLQVLGEDFRKVLPVVKN